MATNGGDDPTPTAAPEAGKPPAGVIIPPPGDIRDTIEKTAAFIARKGPGIEQRIRDNHGGNPKFSFLMSAGDAYNPYYEWRKDEYRAGNVPGAISGTAAAAAGSAEDDKPKGPPKPPDFEFSARMPRINLQDLEVIRLTALFTARNGRQFMKTLARRSAGNPQFQFLVPNHTFHNFFQNMVDQYAILLREGGATGDGTKAQEERVAALRQNVEDRYRIMERAKQRGDYTKWQETERQKKEEKEEADREQFASIDWNDFVIVETIVFTDSDNDANLPPPTSLNDVQYASLEEKNKVSVSTNLRIEEAFPFDDVEYNAYPPSQHQPQGLPVHPAQPQQQAFAPQYRPQRALSEAEEEENRRIQEREMARQRMQQAQAGAMGGGPMKIRDNYVPRAAAKAANKSAQQTALCPNCKQQIPVNELAEHMRIELQDPRWKEQKAKAESRYAPATLSSTDAASNIKRLASQRPDVFDAVTGQPVSVEEQMRAKKMAYGVEEQRPNTNVEDQIRAIHNKFSTNRPS